MMSSYMTSGLEQQYFHEQNFVCFPFGSHVRILVSSHASLRTELWFPPVPSHSDTGVYTLQVAQWYRIRLPTQEPQEMWVRSLGWEDSLGGGHGNSLQYSCLENSMDRGAWRAKVHRVTKNLTQLNRLSPRTCVVFETW